MLTAFDNKITEAIRRMDAKLADLDADAIARLEENSKLDLADWLEFGDKPSRSMLAGITTQGEAQTLHAIHTDYNNGASLAARIVFLQCMSEILTILVKKGM
jgi:hypothetical protein